MAIRVQQTETSRLRQQVAALQHEVDALQAELARQEAGGSRAHTVPQAGTPRGRHRRVGPEALLLAAGGVLILLGVAFFLALSIASGWLTPALQVALAEGAGGGVLLFGGILLRRPTLRDRLRLTPPLAGAIVGIGAGVALLGLVASALAYDAPVLPVGVALAITALVAAFVCAAAIWADALWLAGFGLGAALLAPLALDTGTSYTALAFIGIGLVATTGLAVVRSWPWLGPVALVTTAPQLIAYMQDTLGPSVSADIGGATWALLGLALGWWLLVAYASIGCVMIRPLERTSLPLSLGFALPAGGFAVVVLLGFRAAGEGVVFGDITVPALVILAVAHAALAMVFALQADRASANGALLAAALLAAIALPIDTDRPLLIILWGALAVAVTTAGQRQGERVLVGAGLLLAGITWVAAVVPTGPESLLFGAADVVELTIEYAAVIAVLLLIARVLRTDSRARIARFAAAATAFAWASVLFITLLTPEAIRLERGPDPAQGAQAALSILWSLVGLSLIALAVRDRRASLRFAGIAVLGATALKVVLFDTTMLAAGIRVAALIIAGVVLVAGAWLLSRLVEPDDAATDDHVRPARLAL